MEIANKGVAAAVAGDKTENSSPTYDGAKKQVIETWNFYNMF